MKTVFKYPLEVVLLQTIIMPANARPIAYAVQAHAHVVWALVDTDREPEARRFLTLCTGEPAPDDISTDRLIHIGTASSFGEVTHLFEVKP